MCHCISDVLSSCNPRQLLSALIMTICGFLISSLRAVLSFLVKLSCLCLSSSSISSLILWRNVSSVYYLTVCLGLVFGSVLT